MMIGLPRSESLSEKTVTVADQVQMIITTAGRYHYAPRSIDDEFSKSVFDAFLKTLDPAGIIFTVEQVTNFKRYRTLLDNQIKNRSTAFADTVALIFEKQLSAVETHLYGMEQREFDFSRNDTLWLGGENTYGNAGQYEKRWEQFFRYLILYLYHTNRDSTGKSNVPSRELAKKLTKEVIARETCKLQLKRTSAGGVRQSVGLAYLKAIAASFDPHTVYLSTAEREMFENELSASAGSFGMSINLNPLGEVEVTRLIPGGPAWRTNAVNEGDILLEMKKSDGSIEGFRCVSLSKVQEALTLTGNENVVFKLRKKTGKIETVALNKELLDVEENIIRAIVLKGDKRFGYLYLPSFYEDFSYADFVSRGCANDLAKELIRLKADSLQGIVIDIRSNGGGSMREALRVAGIFIDMGALCIAHERKKEPQIIKDDARGMIYGGPLVVLVNSFSASAAELFAGVMQDYNRAVIAGSITFGKSTMQVVLPVDAGAYDNLSHYRGTPCGFLKITEGSFYRVNGKSHQRRGIEPDIPLPDLFEGNRTGEASLDDALSLDSISKKTYYYPSPTLPIEQLRRTAVQRVKKNRHFSYVTRTRPFLPKFNTRYAIPLESGRFSRFFNLQDEAEDSLASAECPFSTMAPSYLREKASIRASQSATTGPDTVMSGLRRDIYIIEAYNILRDLTGWAEKENKQ